MTKTFKILSIDGGGIKGLYSLYVLHEFEKFYCKNNETISDYFDMVCGTSTGGIIALGISLKIPIIKLIELYENNANDIFPGNNHNSFVQPFVNFYYSMWQFVGYKYSNESLKNLLSGYFKNNVMNDAHNLLCIPSYNLSTCKNVVFKNTNCDEYKTYTRYGNIKMIDVALATSSAPTYFQIHEINDEYYVDGGIWANNPSTVGILESIHHFVGKNKQYDNYDVLSIGNIDPPKYYEVTNKKHFWNVFNLDEFIDVMFKSNSLNTFFTSKIISNETNGKITCIKHKTTNKKVYMDNTSKDFLIQLKNFGIDDGKKNIEEYNFNKKNIKRFFENKKTFQLNNKNT